MSFIVKAKTEREVRSSTRKILGNHIKIVNRKVYKLYKYVSIDTTLRIVCLSPNEYALAYEEKF